MSCWDPIYKYTSSLICTLCLQQKQSLRESTELDRLTTGKKVGAEACLFSFHNERDPAAIDRRFGGVIKTKIN